MKKKNQKLQSKEKLKKTNEPQIIVLQEVTYNKAKKWLKNILTLSDFSA